MGDDDAFLRRIARARGAARWVVMRVYADWLQEQERAEWPGWVFCSMNQRWPKRDADGSRWFLFTDDPIELRQMHAIPFEYAPIIIPTALRRTPIHGLISTLMQNLAVHVRRMHGDFPTPESLVLDWPTLTKSTGD